MNDLVGFILDEFYESIEKIMRNAEKKAKIIKRL